MLQNVGHLNCYMHHLTQLAENQEVMILNDICNEQGAVIVPKGRPLDSVLAKRLESHKLSTPLEQCVAICDGIGSAHLLKLYQNMIKPFSSNGLKKIVRSSVGKHKREFC